ncbi:17053_t:CDS:2, partial [Acaulospora colombiana]
REEMSKIQDDINRERQRIAEKKVQLSHICSEQMLIFDTGLPGAEKRMGFWKTRSWFHGFKDVAKFRSQSSNTRTLIRVEQSFQSLTQKTYHLVAWSLRISSKVSVYAIDGLGCALCLLYLQMTPAERLRQHQRALAKAQRELDRERTKLEQQEKKLIADIRKSAKAGQMNACKVMAKDLVRTRRYVQKFYQMRTQLQAVGLRIQTLRSNQQMADAMRGATRAMGAMNRGMNLPSIQRIMNEFEKESAMMDMKEEMMSDAVDDKLGEAPTALHSAATPVANKKQAVALGGDDSLGAPSGGGNETVTSAEEDALQERLNRLRGP